MIYEQLDPQPRSIIESDLRSNDPMVVTRALLRGALHEPDREWIEAACITALFSPDLNIQFAGVTGLCHLARRFGVVDLDKVMLEFVRVREQSEMTGLVDDTLDEIKFHLERQRN